MWRLKVVVGYAVLGAIFGPIVGMTFVEYSGDNSLRWSAIVDNLKGEAQLAAVLSSLGLLVGVGIGLFRISKGERNIDL